jgi:hypothetical protein
VKSSQFAEATASASKDAWRDFFRIGEEIKSSDSPEVATLTSTMIFKTNPEGCRQDDRR